MNKKKILWLSLCLLACVTGSAQTQQGYVKTKGHKNSNGTVKPGVPLPGTTVMLKGRSAVVSNNNGTFSLVAVGKNFYLQNVQKQGYVLTDPDVLSRQYFYSENPLILVLDNLKDLETERRDIARKANSALYAQLEEKSKEIDALREQQKITEERYEEMVQELNKYEDDHVKIIKDMVERYSKIDFDQMDEFDLEFSDCIINGNFRKADSLLKSKGDVDQIIGDYNKLHAANEEATKTLEQSRQIENQTKDEASKICYNWFELCKMRHQNDSAALFLEKRMALDPENIEWMLERGQFLMDYLADFQGAKDCFQKAYDISVKKNGEIDVQTAYALNSLGIVTKEQGYLDEAKDYLEKALNIRKSIYGESHPEVATSYLNVGNIYELKDQRKEAMSYFEKALAIDLKTEGENSYAASCVYNSIAGFCRNSNMQEKAKDYYEKALNIRLSLLGEQSTEVAEIYSNLGGLYKDQDSLSLAIDNYIKALQISKDAYGDRHPDVATIIDNIGVVLQNQGKFQEALDHHLQAMEIRKHVCGEMHPNTAVSYSNIATTLSRLGQRQEALEYLQKSLECNYIAYGERSSAVANDYGNIGSLLQEAGLYDKALEYFEESLDIAKEVYGEQHDIVARNYNNMGTVYVEKKDYENAKIYMQKALQIYTNLHGENHSLVALAYNNLGSLYLEEENYDSSLEYFQKALDIDQELLGEQHPSVVTCYKNVGTAYYKLKNYDRALEFFKKGHQINEQIYGEKIAVLDDLLPLIGQIYEKKDDVKEALNTYLEYHRILLSNYDKEHEEIIYSTFMVYVTYLALMKSKDNSAYQKEFNAFMADKIFAGIVQDDSPASKAGLSGEFYFLEYGGIPVNEETSFFAIVDEMREKPKNLVIYKDGNIIEKYFEGVVGCRNVVRFIEPEQKEKLINQYKQWKTSHREE